MCCRVGRGGGNHPFCAVDAIREEKADERHDTAAEEGQGPWVPAEEFAPPGGGVPTADHCGPDQGDPGGALPRRG